MYSDEGIPYTKHCLSKIKYYLFPKIRLSFFQMFVFVFLGKYLILSIIIKILKFVRTNGLKSFKVQ